jgi:PAS domain-containing protein
MRLELFTTLTGPVEEIQHQPDGKILRLVQTPHPLGGIILTVEDVTSYLRLESDLRVMLAVYRESIDHLYEGILLFGTDNRVILTNPALGELWGISGDQRKTGRHVTHLIDEIQNLLIVPQDWEDYKNHILDNMSDRIPKIRELYLTNSNVYQFSYIPLPDGSNLVIFLDITNQKEKSHDLSVLSSSILSA